MSKVKNNVPKIFDRLETELTEFTREGAKAVKDRIAEQGKEAKSGETYGDHQASAPGEPWATDSEELIESFTFEEMILKTTVGSALLRAQGLEEGIKNSEGEIKIEPRPSVEPAFEAVLPTLEAALRKHVSRAQRAT